MTPERTAVVDGLHPSYVTNWALARNGIYFQSSDAHDALQFFDFAPGKRAK
jgi:hypothetical protein